MENRPYWVYRSQNDAHTRPDHLALDGTIERYDSPFWRKYYPPNDWGCRCYVDTLAPDQVAGKTIGAKYTLRLGEGWDYNPGEAAFYPDLDKYQPDIAQTFCKGVVTGAPFEVFYASAVKTGAGAAEKFAKNPRGAKSGADYLYKYMSKPKSHMPVAVLDDTQKELLGTKTGTVNLSADSLAKNTMHHPDITLSQYQLIPDIVGKSDILVLAGGGQKIICFASGRNYYKIVIKTTKDGGENFVVSYHKTDAAGVRKELNSTHNRVIYDKLGIKKDG